jgi:hypothetical protein
MRSLERQGARRQQHQHHVWIAMHVIQGWVAEELRRSHW